MESDDFELEVYNETDPLSGETKLRNGENHFSGSVNDSVQGEYGDSLSGKGEDKRKEIFAFRVIILLVCSLFLLATFPLSLLFCVKVVKEYERAVILRLGRVVNRGCTGPGIVIVIPCTDSFIKIDLRLKSFEVPPQEILTKDSVTVSVDAVVYFRIYNPESSIVRVKNAVYTTRLHAQTTIRNLVGGRTLTETLLNRGIMSQEAKVILDQVADPWGVRVERVEMKDIRLPQQLQRVMAAEAEAKQDAKAKLIAAKGELNAAENLFKASMIINESDTALQLRYLQTLSAISGEKNSTILFPLATQFFHVASKEY